MGRIDDATVPPEDREALDWFCWRGRDSGGYRCQRYEVRAMRPKADVPLAVGDVEWEEFVVGWTEQEDGGSLVKGVNLHPTWHSARVHDLGEDLFERQPTMEMVK